jgi:hypothetical protein
MVKIQTNDLPTTSMHRAVPHTHTGLKVIERRMNDSKTLNCYKTVKMLKKKCIEIYLRHLLEAINR